MAETLLGKGFKLLIHDSEVELTRLTGANKLFLETKLPHINSLLVKSLDELLSRSKVLVVCKNDPEYRELPKRLTVAHQVIDLVAALRTAGMPPSQYRGLYW
jgi:GDP-mannose 6-dehydrogenase